MPRRISLPVSGDSRLSLARARARLGGRVGSHGRAGEIARLNEVVGVVVWSDEASCDVWVGGDRIRRVPLLTAMLAPEVSSARETADPPPSAALAEISADARAFARLQEGQDVTFDGAGSTGRLIEKCRWGGLVARTDGRIVAVGFRRFAPPATN